MGKQNGCFLETLESSGFVLPHPVTVHWHILWPKIGIGKAIASLPINVLSIIVKCIYCRWRVLLSSDDLHFVGDTGINFAWQEGFRLAPRDGVSF